MVHDTPSVIVDYDQMCRNIRKIAEIARRHGVSVRPHTKTHKIPEIAKLQLAAGAGGITVAKLSEAEVMARSGVRDIFVAYPIVSDRKLERLAKLNESANLIVGVDSERGASAMAAMATDRGIRIQVRLEVDTGLQRTGATYSEAVSLAETICKMDGLALRGIYTFRGNFMNGQPTLDLENAGLEEGRLMTELADRMRSRGIPVQDVSVGSTPTAPYAAMVKGITEVRPGTYVFYDRMQASLGSCSLEECAASVRVTVVSRPAPDRIVIDGGSKTFATDVAPGAHPLYLQGFGHIKELPDAVIEKLSEEHGMVRILEEAAVEIGDVLHVIPNHICSTVNLHSRIYFEEDGILRAIDVEGRGMVF